MAFLLKKQSLGFKKLIGRPTLARCRPFYQTILTVIILTAGVAESNAEEWKFRAYLDGKEIGEHRFATSPLDDKIKLNSKAEFDVKFLFFTAYSYRHSAEELWKGNCLHSLQSRTEEKGEVIQISTEKTPQGLIVKSDDRETVLPECPMTFAYWNPQMLEQKKLLNPQNGDWIDVIIKPMGRENITVREKRVTAERFSLTAPKMQIDLWYLPGEQKKWLALRSVTPEGRVIEYRLL